MTYKVTRSELDDMKIKYGMENDEDHAFLQWWRRNHGTGYEAHIVIIEG